MKIVGIGNAIIDVICKVDEIFLERNGLTKSTMKLVDEENFNKFLNSFSSKNNFIVLFVRLFSRIKLSLTLQITSTIAFPIPKIFILSFFCNNRFFSIWVATSTYFAT